MSATSEQHRVRTSSRWAVYGATAAAVTAAAAAGGKAVDPGSRWYRALDKPPWQPPSWAFGVVWTPLYATVAYRNRSRPRLRRPR